MSEKVKVLIVEDEAIVAQNLCMELQLEGYHVCGFVATGEEAISLVKQEDPDLILMDVNLIGDMDGIETSEKIMELKKIPIIFMTGYSKLEFSDRAMKLNPVGYFNKPIDVEMITPLIDEIFNCSQIQ